MKIKNLLAIVVLAALVFLIFRESQERALEGRLKELDRQYRNAGSNVFQCGFGPWDSRLAEVDYFEYANDVQPIGARVISQKNSGRPE